ncbi:DUF1648 domain-containing protein [Candidatus Aminicenantes bacterium AC-335-L06]|jgi:uncharacterized membrane protein|nr:DUF1648 domain-containing protein [Candidatus Aminicenantes bacterium AC-335-L06]
MSFVAFPKLPEKIPVHFNFSGKPDSWKEKSVFSFFLLPIIQTIFITGFFLLAYFSHSVNFPKKESLSTLSPEKREIIYSLIKEFVFLVMIFFNLLFIHLQRSVILTAHQITRGIDKSYFYSIIGIIFMLIFLYFLRIKVKIKELLIS